jgi:magnesium and cobalt transporter
MIAAIQLWIAVVAAALALWSAVVALALESYAPLPRMLASRLPDRAGAMSEARGLHLVHLGLLLAAGALAAAAVNWWGRPPAESLPRFLLATLLVWMVGDLLPRGLGALAPDLVRATQGIARLTLRLGQPVLALVERADRRGQEAAARAVRLAPTWAERGMLGGVFALREMTVAEVMTPRIDILAVDLSHDWETVRRRFRESGHSRLLVYDGHPDAVVGVLHAKDLLPSLPADEQDWQRLVRPALFVPEAKTLAAQLRDFQRGPSHLAVVVDEFGGTAGLVTLEDVLEQIVGEIRDEYDVDEVPQIQDQGPGRWLVQGGTPLADLEEQLQYEFGREDVDTVGGLVLAVLGRVPPVGESLELGPFRLTVDQVVRRRVGRVVVEAVAPASASSEQKP